MEEKSKNSKYILISQKDKYKMTNDKITSLNKEYYNLINSFAYEMNYIEHIINSYYPKKNFSIKDFLDNQQLLIKELVIIINNLIKEKQKLLFKPITKKSNSITDIIRNNKANNDYLKNITKTNDENTSFDINLTTNINTNNSRTKADKKLSDKLKLDLSFLNAKEFYNKRKKINQYINKKEVNEFSKSSSTTYIIPTKNKNYINISNSFINNNDTNKINNINNSISSLINGISTYNNKINLKMKNDIKRNNTTNNYKNKRNFSTKKSNNYYSTNYLDAQKDKNKITPIQMTDYSSHRVYIATATSNYNDSVSEEKFIKNEKYKNIWNNKKLKINNLKKYEIVSNYQIKPNRMTKEMYNISYSILNKYEQKIKRNTSIGKRSKSLLL